MALKDTKGLNEEDYTIVNIQVVHPKDLIVVASIGKRGILLVTIFRYLE
jgi:hypothetical protein